MDNDRRPLDFAEHNRSWGMRMQELSSICFCGECLSNLLTNNVKAGKVVPAMTVFVSFCYHVLYKGRLAWGTFTVYRQKLWLYTFLWQSCILVIDLLDRDLLLWHVELLREILKRYSFFALPYFSKQPFVHIKVKHTM